jgi:peptide chain release factor 1
VELAESRPGFVLFRASGAGAGLAFGGEGGGHRWQRVPPNEKRGRVHTSTVTVAVLREPSEQEVRISPADVEITTARGTGPGGQARNKTESAVIVTHKPTGMVVRCDLTRSQPQNRSMALGMLRARLLDAKQSAATRAENDARRAQVGSGMRGDKIRTIRSQDDTVTDHRTGVRMRFRDYERGEWGRFPARSPSSGESEGGR